MNEGGNLLKKQDADSAPAQLEGKTKKEVLDQLLLVGPSKPLGYLPLHTIETVLGVDIDDLKKELDRTGKQYATFTPTGGDDEVVGLESLYVYDADALQDFLNIPDHKKALEEEGWPTTPREFALATASRFASSQRMFDLIADAFANHASPGHSRNGGYQDAPWDKTGA